MGKIGKQSLIAWLGWGHTSCLYLLEENGFLTQIKWIKTPALLLTLLYKLEKHYDEIMVKIIGTP